MGNFLSSCIKKNWFVCFAYVGWLLMEMKNEKRQQRKSGREWTKINRNFYVCFWNHVFGLSLTKRRPMKERVDERKNRSESGWLLLHFRCLIKIREASRTRKQVKDNLTKRNNVQKIRDKVIQLKMITPQYVIGLLTRLTIFFTLIVHPAHVMNMTWNESQSMVKISFAAVAKLPSVNPTQRSRLLLTVSTRIFDSGNSRDSDL